MTTLKEMQLLTKEDLSKINGGTVPISGWSTTWNTLECTGSEGDEGYDSCSDDDLDND